MSNPVEQMKKTRRVTMAYKRLFGSKDGKAVLEDMREAFGLHMPAFIPQVRGRHCEYDPIHAAIRDGQRQVVMHIEAKLSAKAVADGDDDKPKTTVKK